MVSKSSIDGTQIMETIYELCIVLIKIFPTDPHILWITLSTVAKAVR